MAGHPSLFIYRWILSPGELGRREGNILYDVVDSVEAVCRRPSLFLADI